MSGVSKKTNHVKKQSDDKQKIVLDESLRGQQLIFRTILGAVLIFGITFLYPIDRVYLPIEIPIVGEVASRDLIAPIDFPIQKTDEELKKDRELVIRNLRPVVVLDTVLSAAVRDRIRRFFDRADSMMASGWEPGRIVQTLRYDYPALAESSLFFITTPGGLKKAESFCLELADTVLAAGLISNLENLPFKESGLVTLVKGDLTRTMSRDQLFDFNKAQSYISMKGEVFFAKNPAGKPVSSHILTHFLEADLKFDKDTTTRNKDAEMEAITPFKGWVYKDEKIIKANERFTDIHRDKLLSLARFRRAQLSQDSIWQYLLPPLGRLFFVAFPILFFAFYLYYFRRPIFRSNSALVLFAILFGGLVIILNIVVSQQFLSPYLVPITIASMLVTIAFDLETGLFLTFAASILVGILSGFKLDVAFLGIAAGTVATFSVRKVRHRHEFYRSIIYLSVVYFGIVYIVESLKLTPMADLWRHSGLAILNGFLSPILTIGLLPLFESTFGLTTDITLLELSDLNRPLLKRLALEAPGTYHHSIMIGTLAEEAAKSINGNSLLARVGSYYHDIGKMLKPEYFVENQMGAKNKHEKLAPSMSALILEAHVKEGKELAEKNGLPDCIIEFITGHHGKGVMSYFYDKAKKAEGEEANIDEYRYPGPKPITKEVAIVMLADSVEAASRTLEDPTPARIRGLVRKIFSAKFESGDLEDCDLTLNDLHLIEESFIRILTGIFHRRIAYPEKESEGVKA